MKKKFFIILMLSISIFIVVISLTACSEKSEHTHTLSKYQAIAATCINYGNIDYWYCSGCEKYFSDEHAKNEITKEQTVKQKLGHSFTNYISNNDATCTTDGTKTAKCDRCDEKDTIIDIGSHGHKYINGICIVCGEGQEPATIQSLKGGKIDGMNISMFVEHDVDYVTLIDKIIVGKSDIWDLCFDVFGNDKIDSKIAAQKNGKLNNGDNTFYIFVKEKDGNAQNTYILTIYRSFSIEVNYYNGNELLKTDNVYTGYEYISTFTPEIRGYTFNRWLDSENQMFTNAVLWNSIDLYADKTAKTFRVSFITDSKAQPIESFMAVYDQQVTLPASSKTGYTFNGWLDGNEISENTFVWNFLEDKEYTAKFTAKQYIITYIPNGGTIENTTQTVTYDSEFTLYDISRRGYAFKGYTYNNTIFNSGIWNITCDITLNAEWEISFDAMQNFIFDVDTYTIRGIRDKTVTEIFVPDYVKSIASGAFRDCRGWLTSITIPFVGESKDGTRNTHFGYIFGAPNSWNNSDYVPSSLKEVVITGNSNIDSEAFYGCNNLTSVTISDGVANIGSHAFNGCSSLTKITIGNGVTVIESYAFNGCSSLTNIIIPDSVKLIDNGAFKDCYNLKTIIIGNSVQLLSQSVFENCRSLTNITIPESVTEILPSLFLGCSSLKSITIPFVGATKDGTKNTHFGYLFGMSDYLDTPIYVPSSLKEVIITGGTIDDCAFYKFNGLTSIIIGDKVENIGMSAFYACSSLTTVKIGNGVKTISSGAFSDCCSLVNITLPKSITSIQEKAFNGCNNLTVFYKGTVEDWEKISIGSYNDAITSAVRYYYSGTEPKSGSDETGYDGKYWHYINGEIIIWVKEN